MYIVMAVLSVCSCRNDSTSAAYSFSVVVVVVVCIKSTIKAGAKLRTLNYYARCWVVLNGLCVEWAENRRREDSPAALEWIDIFSASRNSNFIIITPRHATLPTRISCWATQSFGYSRKQNISFWWPYTNVCVIFFLFLSHFSRSHQVVSRIRRRMKFMVSDMVCSHRELHAVPAQFCSQRQRSTSTISQRVHNR